MLTDGHRFSKVSLSRSGPWGVLAGSLDLDIAALGIDLEDSRRVGFDGFDSTALSVEERALVRQLSGGEQRNMLRARLWARKEAVLKAAGTGLAQDPAGVAVLADHHGATHLTDVDIAELGLPAHLVVSLAVTRLVRQPGHRAGTNLFGA